MWVAVSRKRFSWGFPDLTNALSVFGLRMRCRRRPAACPLTILSPVFMALGARQISFDWMSCRWKSLKLINWNHFLHKSGASVLLEVRSITADSQSSQPILAFLTLTLRIAHHTVRKLQLQRLPDIHSGMPDTGSVICSVGVFLRDRREQ